MLLTTALLGLLSGALTTVAGVGGGTLLVVALSLLGDPKQALAVTAPALFLGNAHRAFLFRAHADRAAIGLLATGGLVGGALGGAVLAHVSNRTIDAMMVLATCVAVGKFAFRLRFRVPRALFAPAAFVVGGAAATSGAGGLLLAPLLLSAGLTGPAYVATASSTGVAIHLGRIGAYGATGLLGRDVLVATAALAVALFVGNVAGRRLRAHVDERAAGRLEIGSLVVTVLLAVAGFTR